MEKVIVIINGTGGSGKDTFIDFVKKYAKVVNVSSVDFVKEVATLAGWQGEKSDEARKFLSDLKVIMTAYNDGPFRSIASSVEKFRNSDSDIMFIHIRELENIKRAVDSFGAYTLLVKREGLENISTNYSDANVDNYAYDFYVENNTLEGLDKSAELFVRNFDKSHHYARTLKPLDDIE